MLRGLGNFSLQICADIYFFTNAYCFNFSHYESKGKEGCQRAAFKIVAASPRTCIMFLSTFYTMRSDDNSSLCYAYYERPIYDYVFSFMF